MGKKSQKAKKGTLGPVKATVIYLHIPRCAGSTMMRILRANYKSQRMHRMGNAHRWGEFLQMEEERKKKIGCLTGHIPYGLHQSMPQRCHYAVMLREPVDRICSLYYFIREMSKGHRYHQWANSVSLAQFATSQRFAEIDNGMTRTLCGHDETGSIHVIQPVNDYDLTIAESHAEDMAIGFVEEFDQGIELFAGRFGWRYIDYYKRVNINNRRPPITNLSDKDRATIEKANKFDVELYRWAKARI